MRLSFGQHLQQVQKQVLAPRMIQSMEILQLPIMALQERIDQEMEENPILEMQEEDPDLPSEPVEEKSPDERSEEEKELVIDETNNNEDDFERLMKMDEEWPDHFEERSRPSRSRIDEAGQHKLDAMANMAARPQTLQDYLHDQLGWFDLDASLRATAERIVYNLNPAGYFQGSLEELLGPDAEPHQLATAREALALVQRLDPPGVAARDYRECLLLQLTPGNPFYEILHALITSHFDDLTHNRLPIVAKRTGYSIEMIQTAMQELGKLNLNPGGDFSESFVPPVIPDVFVERSEEGKYEVRLEDGRTPELFISPYYRKLLSAGKANDETKQFIRDKINSAQWLIESIQQRRNTLTRVAQAIVDYQTEFLDKGPDAIEPLKMQQIADQVGVHVTTVSRAVDDKWIQTPRGIFPLKRFFCGGTVGADGAEVAWDAVRLKLQEIVDSEDKQHPFSDDQLVAELTAHGVKVARRTVTKYRKAMNIPSSRQRRDWSLSTPDKKGNPE
ncbi:MAG: RNA polymerase factor sigma-54 [Planctomycetes bacterium]|nr:RNA polymerase factor sigma-54 [Planctomycetota bacterium]